MDWTGKSIMSRMFPCRFILYRGNNTYGFQHTHIQMSSAMLDDGCMYHTALARKAAMTLETVFLF
jgi:hypothetical protein